MEIKTLWKLIRFAGKNNFWMSIASVLLDTSAILFSAGLFGTAALLISMTGLRMPYELVAVPVVGVRFFGLSRSALRYAERILSHDTTFRLLRNLRVYIYDKAEPMLPDMKAEFTGADIASRIISDVENLQEAFLRVAYPVLTSLVMLLIGVLTAYALDPQLALLFVLLYIPSAFIAPALLATRAKGMWSSASEVKQMLYGEFLEYSYGLKEILSNGRESDWKGRLDATLRKEEELSEKNHRLSAVSGALAVFVQSFSLIAFVLFCTWMATRGSMSGVHIAASALVLAALFEGIQPVLTAHTRTEKVSVSAQNIFGDDKAFIPGEDAVSVISPAVHLSVNHLSYADPYGRPVLTNFSVELEKGQIKAVLGPSGVGKSTLINLILGFLKGDSGTISIDDGLKDRAVLLDHTDSAARLKYFSVSEQHPYLFHATVRENLLIGNPEATDEDILEACRKANILELISGLPEGLDTVIAETGASLSAGEVQRLAMARAIVKPAPFYLFDEPTAGLDAINEKRMLELLLELKRDHGVLLITHRRNMLETMDEVIELERAEARHGTSY